MGMDSDVLFYMVTVEESDNTIRQPSFQNFEDDRKFARFTLELVTDPVNDTVTIEIIGLCNTNSSKTMQVSWELPPTTAMPTTET